MVTFSDLFQFADLVATIVFGVVTIVITINNSKNKK